MLAALAGEPVDRPPVCTPTNVATVEFIGICQSPSAGKQWWGPDGSLLQGAPYVNASTILRQRADRNVFEIVRKVT